MKRWRALVVLTLARLCMGFQFQSLASVSSFLVDDLAVTYTDIGFLIGLYVLPGVVFAIPGGLLGQRFGDRRVVAVGLVLMVVGGALSAMAHSYAFLLSGRLIAGIGGVLLNVLMIKIITDWFAQHEMVLAISILMNAYPIGVGLSLASLGLVAETFGWQAAFAATAAAALLSFLLLLAAYERHPNDGRVLASTPTFRIPKLALALVCLAGIIWGIFNGVWATMFGFTPTFLIDRGMRVAETGFILGLLSWLTVGSVLAGGIIAERWKCPNTLLIAGVLGWGIGLMVLPSAPAVPLLIVMGCLQGLPVGVIVSLPAQVLRPENRATGMGIFQFWSYLGFAVLPPFAGWFRDLTRSASAPLYFGGLFVLAVGLIFVLFRLLQRRQELSASLRLE
ncbi:MAG: MFS transporter [Planctomycetota bacterium]|jgi:predicted MFS family arabinose efflux permease